MKMTAGLRDTAGRIEGWGDIPYIKGPYNAP